MLLEYRKIATSAEVYSVIRAKHQDLKVFSSYSAPYGDEYGDPTRCVMQSEFGFEKSDCPIVGIHTSWDRAPTGSYERPNEQHKYWLCIPAYNED